MKFVAHKKALLSVLLLGTTSLSQAQNVVIPVTIPDSVVKNVMQDHIIQIINGQPVIVYKSSPQQANVQPIYVQQPGNAAIQQRIVGSTVQQSLFNRPDVIVTKPDMQGGCDAVQQVAVLPTMQLNEGNYQLTQPRQATQQGQTTLAVQEAPRTLVYSEQAPQGVQLYTTASAYQTAPVGPIYHPGRSAMPIKHGRYIERVSHEDLKATFIPKGMWMLGCSANFQEWDNNESDLLVLKNMNLEGHVFSVSPSIAYVVGKNTAIGLRYSYSRNYFFLGDFDLNLGEDFNISLHDLYYLDHKHEGGIFMRNYMPLFGSKVFGFFSDLQASYSHSTGKNSTGDPAKENFDGVYERSQSVGLGFAPGLCIFATNTMAFECSVGVLGLNYRWTDQKHYEDNADEPVYEKRSQSGGANFKINLLSIKLGLSLYL